MTLNKGSLVAWWHLDRGTFGATPKTLDWALDGRHRHAGRVPT